jgi:phospholipid-binding lipoprotein MlaA
MYGKNMNIKKIRILILFLILPIFFYGCASSPDTAGKQENDPFESFNRQIYSFNEGADEYVIGPIAHAYRDVFPEPVRESIRNFLLNLKTPMSAINATLQGEFERGITAVGRFTINTTVGILGLFDVANYIGLDPVDEDLGQTLGSWGIESGPYLILPILGPTSTRDLGGKVGDWLIDPVGLYLIREDYESFLLATKVAKALDTRVELDGVIEGTRENSLDPYAIMRTMYLQRRARLIANEESQDTSIYDIDIDVMLLD